MTDQHVDVHLRLERGAVAVAEPAAVVRGVHALAAEHAAGEPEQYAEAVARYCHERIAAVAQAAVVVRARSWERLALGGRPRGRDFLAGPPGRRMARATAAGDGVRIAAGIGGVDVLMAPETAADPLQLELAAWWTYGWPDVPFGTQWQQVRRALLEAYAERRTDDTAALADALGRAVLEEAPAVSRIGVRIAAAGREAIDMTAFGMENRGAVFGATATARTVHAVRLGRSELS